MLVQYIRRVLLNLGYKPVDATGIVILYREDKQFVYVVTLSDISQRITEKDYILLQQKLGFAMATEFRKEIRFLHVILHDDACFDEKELRLTNQMPNVWRVAGDTGRIFVFEYQISDFDNLYKFFENSLSQYVLNDKRMNTFRITPANVFIVMLNVILFLFVIFINGDMYAVHDTEVMLSMGALNYDAFMGGAWYQLVSSLFLHFGLSHLLSNMILLMYVGCELERRIGSVLYMVMYFTSGILGNVMSLLYYRCIGEQVVSAGASGAIFGVIGALFVVLMMNHVKTPNLSPTRLFIMAGITIVYGMTNAGIDNAAHIGGLFVGILGGFLLSKISQYDKLV